MELRLGNTSIMRGGGGENSSLPSLFNAHEIGIANILLEIPYIISQDVSRSSNWCAKRKRTMPKSPLPREQRELEIVTQQFLKPEAAAPPPPAVVAADSPTSPLTLSLSQFDEKMPKNKLAFKKVQSKQRKREEMLEDMDTLTGNICKLRGDLENVRNHYKELMAVNLALKTKRHEVHFGFKMEQPKMDITNTSFTLEMKQDQYYDVPIVSSTSHHQHHQIQVIQDVIKNQRSCGSQMNGSFAYLHGQLPQLVPSSNGLGRFSSCSAGTQPSALFDLSVSQQENFKVDTFQPLDMTIVLESSRIQAANKRKERMSRMKEKKHHRVGGNY